LVMQRSLVVINNLDVESVAIVPAEANPPLIVDPNAPLPLSITF